MGPGRTGENGILNMEKAKRCGMPGALSCNRRTVAPAIPRPIQPATSNAITLICRTNCSNGKRHSGQILRFAIFPWRDSRPSPSVPSVCSCSIQNPPSVNRGGKRRQSVRQTWRKSIVFKVTFLDRFRGCLPFAAAPVEDTRRVPGSFSFQPGWPGRLLQGNRGESNQIAPPQTGFTVPANRTVHNRASNPGESGRLKPD
jgi:hypothetical protein